MKHIFTFFSFLLLAAGLSSAQSNEVSFSGGVILTSDQKATTTITLPLPLPCPFPTCVISETTKTNASTAFTFEASYARQLAGAGPVALYIEFPVVGMPGHGIDTVFSTSLSGPFSGSSSSSLFFLTPSARVKFFSSSRISPWASVGGGWARLTLGSQNTDTGALQFGGGVDFKTGVPHLGFRAEARDFWSAGALQTVTQSTSVVSPEHQHHLFAGGGVVLRL